MIDDDDVIDTTISTSKHMAGERGGSGGKFQDKSGVRKVKLSSLPAPSSLFSPRMLFHVPKKSEVEE